MLKFGTYGGHISQSQLAAGSAQGLTLLKLSITHVWAIACACYEEMLGRANSLPWKGD